MKGSFPSSFAKICGHSRSFAFQNGFNANGRKYPQMIANRDELKDDLSTQMDTDGHRWTQMDTDFHR
jgi:hypothetical protein